MPKAEHEKLKKEADKKGLRGEERDAYIYGTLHKIERARNKKAKGNRRKK